MSCTQDLQVSGKRSYFPTSFTHPYSARRCADASTTRMCAINGTAPVFSMTRQVQSLSNQVGCTLAASVIHHTEAQTEKVPNWVAPFLLLLCKAKLQAKSCHSGIHLVLPDYGCVLGWNSDCPNLSTPKFAILFWVCGCMSQDTNCRARSWLMAAPFSGLMGITVY